jgi:hypothetical protein
MTTRATRWLSSQLGRRGASLLMLGAAFAVIGVKGFLAPTEDDGRFMLYTLLPNFVRGLLWTLPGIAAIVAAFKPLGRDAFGFSGLTVPATVMAVSYGWSSVAYLFGLTDYAFGWTSGLTWLLVLVFILTVAGWPEPERLPRRARHSKGRSR